MAAATVGTTEVLSRKPVEDIGNSATLGYECNCRYYSHNDSYSGFCSDDDGDNNNDDGHNNNQPTSVDGYGLTLPPVPQPY